MSFMKSTVHERRSEAGVEHPLRTCAKFDIKQIHRLVLPRRCSFSATRTCTAELDNVDAVLGDRVQGAGQQNCVLKGGQQLGEADCVLGLPRWQTEPFPRPLR